MGTWRKLFAIGVILLLLGMQGATILPPGDPPDNWYWPFMDYPMYTTAHYAGEEVTLRRLEVVPCGAPERVQPLEARSVYITSYRFLHLVDRASGYQWGEPVSEDWRSGARAFLDTLVARALPEPHCRARILVQTHRLGPHGFERVGDAWEPESEWPLEAAARSRAEAPAAAGSGERTGSGPRTR